ncbi:unnamed protein product [Macrosiphum euphorbiae]|uniref:DDE Tnp4 domain-containing protein n=1 Tax=Macrosiphum euphorbiae TaxID=13131 RepID=A0AAV0XZI3_9HEMI|nr:unnamed protein product [Macrosiphum euphorbiae]
MNNHEHDVLTLMSYLSSSEIDDDELINYIIKQPVIRPKISNFISNVVHSYSDKQFKGSFRMERATAYYLIKTFEDSSFFPQQHKYEPGKTSENYILSYIWFSANKSCLRDVAERFGNGLTTQFRINDRVMNFLIDISPKVINFDEGITNLAREFKKVSGMPHVIGCIDGTSIPIRTPAHKIKSTYTNRHDMPSITLQGVCDYKKKFIDVFTGIPAKIHDARVFVLSDLSKDLPSMCEKKYNLLGDGAYPIREWLLVPYKDYGRLTESQKTFNKTLSSTRVLIENTFGLLKSRFRQLLQLDIHSVDKITKFIISSCVLHNLCIDMDDHIELRDEENEELLNGPDDTVFETDMLLKKNGETKRDAIKNSMQYQ